MKVEKKKKLQKIILAFDGAFEQVSSALEELQVKCEPLNIDLFKWAAACSGYQQANDVERIHADIQRDIRKRMDKLIKQELEGIYSPTYSDGIKAFEQHLRSSEMDKASADTYWDFFRIVEECLAQWTTPAKVSVGWQMAGTWPIDKDQIISSCSKWALLENEQSCELIRNIVDNPALQQLALRGYIHDSELDAIITEPLAGVIVSILRLKNLMEYSRCAHLTNVNYRNLIMARLAKEKED